ncbi:signal peptide containing protein [Theileria equi strain WA]|uniref:Signal peptide containing protein n=1 Tax=Theileria equi strain WA TaxID=1537102 RepID=L1LAA1_THEEQ|nr:signal peptide containing protein [Theileria equi strain WA]EKX72387.1 signal peptide containing protein [Theileria equi strain WA]|eukprot:XP_004831839.1 signal peptide containing protein [Theileria equi strain WA]
MNILLLLIPTCLILSSNNAALPKHCVRKTPVHFDFCAQLPDKIEVRPSAEFIGCLYYTIKEEHERGYRIGNISDRGIIISEDSCYTIRKHVFLVITESGRYIEVDRSRKDRNGKVVKTIEEFYKGNGDFTYYEVDRDPVKFNLLRPRFTQLLDEFVICTGVVKYYIKESLVNGLIIGIVKYGDFILDANVEGVIYKYVIVDRNINNITVTSYMQNATRIDKIFGYVGGMEPFVLLHEFVFDIFLSR